MKRDETRQDEGFRYDDATAIPPQPQHSKCSASEERLGREGERSLVIAHDVEGEVADAVTGGVTHALIYELGICVDYVTGGEVEFADGGGVVAVREELSDEVSEAVHEALATKWVAGDMYAVAGGEAGEVEVEIGEGGPEVEPPLGENGCLNGLHGVEGGEDLLENCIWELAYSVFHFQHF